MRVPSARDGASKPRWAGKTLSVQRHRMLRGAPRWRSTRDALRARRVSITVLLGGGPLRGTMGCRSCPATENST